MARLRSWRGSLTSTFFAELIAGRLYSGACFFLYGDLLLATRRLERTDDAMKIVIPLRPWGRSRTWEWKDISRMDVSVHRRDLKQDAAVLQIYHQFPGEYFFIWSGKTPTTIQVWRS